MLPECIEHLAYLFEPTEEQRRRISEIAEEVASKLKEIIEEAGLIRMIPEVSFQGSFARDTWLPEDTDLDLFILFDKSLDLGEMQRITERLSAELARRLGAGMEARFASHPYYVITLKDVEVEVIPAYKVQDPNEMKSAVDRTPFHTRYILSQLSKNPELKRDIRIFKALLRRLGVYGAELEVRGFSGYLSELLIIHYGGLEPLLRAAASWRPWRILVPESAPRVLRGAAPLVVVDPVDLRRNAAAAVAVEQLSKLIALSRVFTRYPEVLCCLLEAKEGKVEYSPDENILALQLLSHPPMAKDALAGKVRRMLDSVLHALERSGFRVLRASFLRVGDKIFLLVHLEASLLPAYEKRVGPPVWHENSLRFLEKWAANIPAPFIENDRWVVVAPRKTRAAAEVVKSALKAYPGFEWRVMTLIKLLEDLEDENLREKLLRAAGGYEPWTWCLRRFFAGRE